MNFTLKTLTAVALLTALVVGNAHATNLWYDFEGDTTWATDKLTVDGSQNGTFVGDISVQTDPPGIVPWGVNSALFAVPASPPPNSSHIDTPVTGTDLGTAFTMSAAIHVSAEDDAQSNGDYTRLFSTYPGGGSAAGRLIFDFSTEKSAAHYDIRVILPDGTNLTIYDPIAYGAHTLTATYTGSLLEIYVDGATVGSKAASGTVNLGLHTLLIGKDQDDDKGEQFVGTMDDVLILDWALDATEVATLHTSGAAAIVPEPGVFAMLAAGLMMMLIARRKR